MSADGTTPAIELEAELANPDYANVADLLAERAEGMSASAIDEANRATRYASRADYDTTAIAWAESHASIAAKCADIAETLAAETGAIASEASLNDDTDTAITAWTASGYAYGCAKMARTAAYLAEAAILTRRLIHG